MVGGLTADIFVQMTTTLAHLSGLKNKSGMVLESANQTLYFTIGRKDYKIIKS